MATRPYHITRKELRQPDEFISFVDQAGDWIANNLSGVILGAVAVLIVIIAIVGVRFYLANQQQAAAEGFYQAIVSFDHRDYKTATQQFIALNTKYPHTSLGRLARFYVGNGLLAQKENAQARDALQQYLGEEDRPAFREMALMQLGVAYENLGNYPEARRAYERAAALNGPEKGRAERNAARVMVKAGDKAGAIAVYRSYLSENPYAPERAQVIEALAQLGAGPAASTNPTAMRKSTPSK
jgi:tetratricopeptide (TPR) repeat protein